MHTFARPPYLRWAAAGAILVAAFAIELWPRTEVLHPFLRIDVAAGEVIGDEALRWEHVPAGLLPVMAEGGLAAVDVAKGEPLLPSHLTEGPRIPPGWWSVPVALPAATPYGVEVQLIDTEIGQVTDGIVIGLPSTDAFTFDATGLVAVPGEQAAAVAVAAAADRLTVILATG